MKGYTMDRDTRQNIAEFYRMASAKLDAERTAEFWRIYNENADNGIQRNYATNELEHKYDELTLSLTRMCLHYATSDYLIGKPTDDGKGIVCALEIHGRYGILLFRGNVVTSHT
jgi:hypothetical protein